MVDAIMLAPRSFINFGNSNGSLHEYNLLVMEWHCRDTLFFRNTFQNNNILNCSRVLTKSYCTNSEFWVFSGICIYKRVRVKVHTHRPRLYATRFELQCGLSWQSIWWVTCTNAYTWPSALDYQKKIFECWPFFVEDFYILLIILCHFSLSVSTAANTDNYQIVHILNV